MSTDTNTIRYAKGFYGQETRLLDAFYDAVEEGDCSEIGVIVAMTGAKVRPVDCLINALPRAFDEPRAVAHAPLGPIPEPGSEEHREHLNVVYRLAALRDQPLTLAAQEMAKSPIPLPVGAFKVSPVLNTFTVPHYMTGRDYGTDRPKWELIQRAMVTEAPELQDTSRVPITSGRSASAFVHHDDPLEPWLVLLDWVLEDGITRRVSPLVRDDRYPPQTNFSVYGKPFYVGLLGDALRQSGLTSFRLKWGLQYPRPEEMAPHFGMKYLPLAYPEGSPTHCSTNAMHSMVALLMAALFKLLFAEDEVVKKAGDTLGNAADLLADNIGYFRVHAGVHYPFDHECIRAKAEALASHIAAPFLRDR